MNEPATLTTPWRKFILPPGVGRASLRVGRRRLRAPRWCAPFQREYGGDYRGRDRRSEDPAMADPDYKQLLQNAIDQLNAQHEEKLKELDKKLTKSFDKKFERAAETSRR